ncbi:hypothetical protein ACIRFF_11005 [Streptomyces cyaneofuscatus]
MTADSEPPRQSPIEVDPATDKLISQGAHFLDGSLKSDVMLLTGLTAEEIDAVGGIDE